MKDYIETGVGVFIVLFMFSASLALSILLINFAVNKTNCDLNHDNELTIQDLSILSAQINNK